LRNFSGESKKKPVGFAVNIDIIEENKIEDKKRDTMPADFSDWWPNGVMKERRR
jgi:hypothetical protein